MSKETGPDPEEAKYLHLSAKTVWVEVARASYALGIGGLVTITLVFGAYVLDIEGSRVVAATVFSTGLLLPVVLYLYDRHHRRDLVIADFGHLVLRPFSFLYRIFQNP
jgi:hypothetical protein